MEMTDLFRSLKDQHQFLETFLNTVTLQQRAIIENDMTGLEETLKTEGALLLHIEKFEKQIIKILKELSVKYELETETGKLSEFIEAMQQKKKINSKPLVKFQISMKKLAMQIAKINAQNRILVEQARNYVQGTIAAIVNSNKSQLFDRKI